VRHPDKKIKYFCESHCAFLCSKCIIAHSGAGHLISEYNVDVDKMKSDFHDVGLKFESVKKEIDGLKNSSDSIDKKL